MISLVIRAQQNDTRVVNRGSPPIQMGGAESVSLPGSITQKQPVVAKNRCAASSLPAGSHRPFSGAHAKAPDTMVGHDSSVVVPRSDSQGNTRTKTCGKTADAPNAGNAIKTCVMD